MGSKKLCFAFFCCSTADEFVALLSKLEWPVLGGSTALIPGHCASKQLSLDTAILVLRLSTNRKGWVNINIQLNPVANVSDLDKGPCRVKGQLFPTITLDGISRVAKKQRSDVYTS